jgi:hypothetical protein
MTASTRATTALSWAHNHLAMQNRSRVGHPLGNPWDAARPAARSGLVRLAAE